MLLRSCLLALVFLAIGCAHAPVRTTLPATPTEQERPPPGDEVVVAPPSHETERVPVMVHVVQPGENLFRIALKYGINADELAKENGIDDPRSLGVGATLVIPRAPPPRVNKPEPAHHVTRPALKPVLTDPHRKGQLDWPLRGVLYARFGKKGTDAHDGIDLAAPLGTPVKTAAPGHVLYAGEQHGYGLIAIVEHENGLVTLYAHNRDLRVKAGQQVREGQVIATVGESGRTSGPHLHFEVRKEGEPVDPLDYLGAAPRADAR
jgi:lipoprotein NlpD